MTFPITLTSEHKQLLGALFCILIAIYVLYIYQTTKIAKTVFKSEMKKIMKKQNKQSQINNVYQNQDVAYEEHEEERDLDSYVDPEASGSQQQSDIKPGRGESNVMMRDIELLGKR
jgi:hypothetical protein